MQNKQLSMFSDLINKLEEIDDFNNKSIVFGGDINLFFEARLETQWGNPVLKKKSSSKLIQIEEKFDLSAIWRIMERYAFR